MGKIQAQLHHQVKIILTTYNSRVSKYYVLIFIIAVADESKEFYDEYENEYYDQYEDGQVCKTISGSHKDQECQFPFTFRGIEYNTCISGSKRRQPWCPTELDNIGAYINGMWGYCDTLKCPLGNQLLSVHCSSSYYY